MKWLGIAFFCLSLIACGGVSAGDFDGDGFESIDGGGDDCDDNDAAVNPESEEIAYNGVDDDCDPMTPDDDLDGDGFAMVGGGDCNDDDPNIFPGADEVPYDGVDQSCSGSDASDLDQDGHDAVEAGGGDCDDLNPSVNPDAIEIPFDAIDQNCDGTDTVGLNDQLDWVSVPEESQSDPAIASTGDGYLAVWSDRRNTQTSEIFGQVFDADGTPQGSDFEIRSTSGDFDAFQPSVATDGTDYLVVWREFDGTAQDIRGQRVSGSGALLGTRITVSNSANFETDADVAFNGQNYLVVWFESDNPDRIRANIITPNGSPQGVSTVRASQIARRPAVTSDGSLFLVVWEERAQGDSFTQIAGQLVGNDGQNDLLSPFPVTQGALTRTSPDAAFDGENYLVVFEAFGAARTIDGQFVNASGNTVLTAADENFLISLGVSGRDDPSVAFLDGFYFVGWRDFRWDNADVYGQKVGTDASLVETSAEQNLPVVATPADETQPQLATDGTRVFCVWRQSQDVRGRLFQP